MEIIEKSTGVPESGELELINGFTRSALKSEDVYTFSVVLCDNEIDRDGEHFSDGALDKLAQMFVGVTGIYDHTPSAKNQVARIFSAKTESVDGRLTKYGAQYRRIRARAYIPRGSGSDEMIRLIDSGIRKEVSVGCGMKKCVCSICGEDMRTGACEHIKGKMYGGKLCCGILDEPTDAYEWSFIAVPAQPAAGVIKQFLPDEEPDGGYIAKRFLEGGEVIGRKDAEALGAYIKSLEEKAQQGERCRSMLMLETVKAGITAKIGIESGLLESMVKGLSVDELLRLKAGFESAAAKILPIRPQTAAPSARYEAEQSGYRV